MIQNIGFVIFGVVIIHKTFNFVNMKKKNLMGIFAIGLLLVSGYAMNKSSGSDSNLSGLAWMNVEALAQINTNGVSGTCTGELQSYCYYRCCVCDALYKSESQGGTISVKGECGECGTPVKDCL